MRTEITMTQKKECKHSVVYESDNKKSPADSIYIKRAWLGDTPPASVVVTFEAQAATETTDEETEEESDPEPEGPRLTVSYGSTPIGTVPGPPVELAEVPAQVTTKDRVRDMSTTDYCKAIRAALKPRSWDYAWSVTQGRGTVSGWVTIIKAGTDCMDPVECERLRELLGGCDVHQQGVKIPSSVEYYAEYLDRAEGRDPSVIATPYW